MALDLHFGGSEPWSDEPALEGIPVGTVWMAARVADSVAGGPAGPNVNGPTHHEFLFGKSHDPRLSAFYPESFVETDERTPEEIAKLPGRPGGAPFKLVQLKNVFSPEEIGDLPRITKEQLLSAVQQQVGHVNSIAEPQEGRPQFLRRSQVEQIEEALKRAQARGRRDAVGLDLSQKPEDILRHLHLTQDGRPTFPVEAGLPQQDMMKNLHVTEDGRPSQDDIEAAIHKLKRVGISEDRHFRHVDSNSLVQPVQLQQARAAEAFDFNTEKGDHSSASHLQQIRVAEAGFHFDLSGLKAMKTALLVTGGLVSKIFGLGIVGFLAWQSMQANVVNSHRQAAAQKNAAASASPASQPRRRTPVRKPRS